MTVPTLGFSLNSPPSSALGFPGCGGLLSRKSLSGTDLLPSCQAQAGGSSLSGSCAWGASFTNWFGLGNSLPTLAPALVQPRASQPESNVCRQSEEGSSKHSLVTIMHPSLGRNHQHLSALCRAEVSGRQEVTLSLSWRLPLCISTAESQAHITSVRLDRRKSSN